MLSTKEIADTVLQVRAEGATRPVPISLEEEAECNRQLAVFLSRENPKNICGEVVGLPACVTPQLVYYDMRTEEAGDYARTHNMILVLKRYICIKCGRIAVAYIERSTNERL